MSKALVGKVALVTGAARGIGWAKISAAGSRRAGGNHQLRRQRPAGQGDGRPDVLQVERSAYYCP